MASTMRGITLLIAVVVTLAALLIGIGIFALLVDEIRFSRSAEDSLAAFYAADSGLECALYWDVKRNIFSISPPSSLTCAGASRSITIDGASKYTFSLSFPNGACSQVIIEKAAKNTTITSQGQNTPCGVLNPRTVQRGLRVKY